jgi:hypothetical protein
MYGINGCMALMDVEDTSLYTLRMDGKAWRIGVTCLADAFISIWMYGINGCMPLMDVWY